MGRRTPLCAWCGKRLRQDRTDETGRLIFMTRYGGVPGSPEVGWHSQEDWTAPSCRMLDPVADKLLVRRGAQPEDKELTEQPSGLGAEVDRVRRLLGLINDRGPGRVVGTKAMVLPRKVRDFGPCEVF